MDVKFLQAYRYFANVFSDDEKSLLQYIANKLSNTKTSTQLRENVTAALKHDKMYNFNIFIATVSNFNHGLHLDYICKIILAEDQFVTVKRAKNMLKYNVNNRGYIVYDNFYKKDRSLLGRLESIREYVINKVEEIL